MEALTGLVACGGLSTRMGRDKSLIEWHGIAQRYFLYRILEPVCKNVFISCNNAQAHEIEPGYCCIIDDEKYSNTGPIASLLTAFTKYPGNSFLLIGCDYPFIKKEDILQLTGNRNEDDVAVSFYNETTGFYEPLLTVYENGIKDLLVNNFNEQQYSLQQMLKRSAACKVKPAEMKNIKSVNTPDEYLVALEEMRKMN